MPSYLQQLPGDQGYTPNTPPPQSPNGFGMTDPAFLDFESGPGTATPLTDAEIAALTAARARTRPARILAAGYNPDWLNAPTQWDTVTIQGVDLPGICKVTGKLGRKLEVNSPAGSDGARLRDKGYEPCTFTINLRMWTATQFATWEQSNLALIAKRGRQRVALQVVHPALSNAGVRLAYLQSVSLIRESSPRGVYEVDITMIEFAPPTPIPATPVVGTLGSTATAFDRPGSPTTPQATTPTNPAAAGPSTRAQNTTTPPAFH